GSGCTDHCRSRQHCRVAQATSLGHRQRSTSLRCEDNGGSAFNFRRALLLLVRDVGDLCWSRFGSCVCWHLRRDGVCSHAAHTGDWNSNGTGCAWHGRFEACAQTWNVDGVDRSRNWFGWRLGLDPISIEVVIRKVHHGFFYVRYGDIRFVVCSLVALLPASSTSDESRSPGSAEV